METTDKTKPQVAVIKELVYELKAIDKAPLDLNSKSKIFLVINDLETSIAIESLFIGKINIDDEDIEGYSILQLLTSGTQLKIDENTTLKITFIDKATGREFYISKIRRSLMYDENMEISPESRLRYIDLLLTTSMIPVETAKAEKEASDAANAAIEAAKLEEENNKKKIEDEEKLRIVAEKLEAQKVEAETERLRIVAEKASIPGGEYWKAQRKELIDDGLTEYVDGEYRFFYKKGEEGESSEIGFFVLTPGNYESIDLYEEEITDGVEEYSFSDYKDDECSLEFNKVDGSLKIVR